MRKAHLPNSSGKDCFGRRLEYNALAYLAELNRREKLRAKRELARVSHPQPAKFLSVS
jgi:hypothetical protein